MDITIQPTNGRSIDFIRHRMSSGECNGMEDNKYDDMCEYNFKQFLENNTNETYKSLFKVVSDNDNLRLDFRDGSGNKHIFYIDIIYDPECEFEYFTMERCSCDGTLIFYKTLMENIILKIVSIKTFHKDKVPPDFEQLSECRFTYRVGDFVLATEHGEEFAIEEKPWLLSRFTAFLPIAFEFSNNKTND